MIVPLLVGRPKSIKALDFAEKHDKDLFSSSKDANTDEPLTGDIYNFGTIASILQLLRLPDGIAKFYRRDTKSKNISFCRK